MLEGLNILKRVFSGDIDVIDIELALDLLDFAILRYSWNHRSTILLSSVTCIQAIWMSHRATSTAAVELAPGHLTVVAVNQMNGHRQLQIQSTDTEHANQPDLSQKCVSMIQGRNFTGAMDTLKIRVLTLKGHLSHYNDISLGIFHCNFNPLKRLRS